MTPGQLALAEAARIETARIYSALSREHVHDDERDLRAEWERWRANQPVRHLRVVVPKVEHSLRTTIEQDIARGHTDSRIAGDTEAPLTVIAQVRADLDALTA